MVRLYTKSSSLHNHSQLPDQATSAQAYLEILRLASRNNTADVHTLFREVASAGSSISTSFAQASAPKGVRLRSSTQIKHDNTSLRALKLVLPKNLNSDETEYIFSRAANRKMQGVSLDHMYWDHIICFRTSVRDELERLKKALVNNAIKYPGSRLPKAEIVLLKTSYSTTDHSQNALNMMKAIDGWAHSMFKYKGYKWNVPEKGIKGMWRSKQILIPEAQYDALCAGGSKCKWNAISAEMKCSLASSTERGGMRLVTITGDRTNLASAAENLAKFWI
jgi:hypothetical protein